MPTAKARKIIGSLVLVLSVVSACEKKPEPITCYVCEMTYASGQPAGTQYPCSYTIEQWQKEQVDTNGQPIESTCIKK